MTMARMAIALAAVIAVRTLKVQLTTNFPFGASLESEISTSA